MTDWSELSHAYGNAADIPDLLDQAGPDAGHEVWQDLWSRLCHQGSVYTASYSAIPALAEKARGWPAPQRFDPLILAASIIASTDSPWPAELVRASLAEEIEQLTCAAAESLQHPSLNEDPVMYIHALQALLAFEGVPVWSDHLDGINNEEYEVPCPHCEIENFVAFGSYGYFSTLDSMYMRNTGTRREPLQPESPANLHALPRRLHTQALADGHPDVAEKITYVFGQATCADCGQDFRVDEAVAARWS